MQSFPPKKPSSRPPRARAESPPLDAARLHSLALAYVARFATSAARLESYLLRKLREPRGRRSGEDERSDEDCPDMRGEVTSLVARFVAAGYVDDRAFAAARSGGLQRRGYGRRHIAQALGQAGIAAETVAGALPGTRAAREAALALARKRRLGPFGAGELEQAPLARAAREKQIAVLVRAGHPLDSARQLVNARSEAAAEAWARADEENG